METSNSFSEGEILKGSNVKERKMEVEKADLLDWLLAIDASLT
jgi:hypothetical protein